MKHRSIGERLSRAKSSEVKREIAHDWAVAWQKEHDDLFVRLEAAIRIDDYDEAYIATRQLKTVNRKKFDAIAGVINKLLDN